VLHKRVMRYCYIVRFRLMHIQIQINVTQFHNLITSHWQLRFFIQDPALHLEFLANYIAELSLLEYSLLSYPPSLIAASAIFLAKFVLKPTKCPWVCGIIMYQLPNELSAWANMCIPLSLEAEFYSCSLHTVQAVAVVRLCKGIAPHIQCRSWEQPSCDQRKVQST
jgi:hypothetical protein